MTIIQSLWFAPFAVHTILFGLAFCEAVDENFGEDSEERRKTALELVLFFVVGLIPLVNIASIFGVVRAYFKQSKEDNND